MKMVLGCQENAVKIDAFVKIPSVPRFAGLRALHLM
jgi:hypothetical protein